MSKTKEEINKMITSMCDGDTKKEQLFRDMLSQFKGGEGKIFVINSEKETDLKHILKWISEGHDDLLSNPMLPKGMFKTPTPAQISNFHNMRVKPTTANVPIHDHMEYSCRLLSCYQAEAKARREKNMDRSRAAIALLVSKFQDRYNVILDVNEYDPGIVNFAKIIKLNEKRHDLICRIKKSKNEDQIESLKDNLIVVNYKLKKLKIKG